jgi:hypothetical protein
MRNEESSLIVVLCAVLVASVLLGFRSVPTGPADTRPVACP